MLGPEGEADLAPAKSMFAIRTCFPECVPDRVPALPQCSICKRARGVVLWALLPIKPVRYPMSGRLLQPDSIFHIKKSTNHLCGLWATSGRRVDGTGGNPRFRSAFWCPSSWSSWSSFGVPQEGGSPRGAQAHVEPDGLTLLLISNERENATSDMGTTDFLGITVLRSPRAA